MAILTSSGKYFLGELDIFESGLYFPEEFQGFQKL